MARLPDWASDTSLIRSKDAEEESQDGVDKFFKVVNEIAKLTIVGSSGSKEEESGNEGIWSMDNEREG